MGPLLNTSGCVNNQLHFLNCVKWKAVIRWPWLLSPIPNSPQDDLVLMENTALFKKKSCILTSPKEAYNETG